MRVPSKNCAPRGAGRSRLQSSKFCVLARDGPPFHDMFWSPSRPPPRRPPGAMDGRLGLLAGVPVAAIFAHKAKMALRAPIPASFGSTHSARREQSDSRGHDPPGGDWEFWSEEGRCIATATVIKSGSQRGRDHQLLSCSTSCSPRFRAVFCLPRQHQPKRLAASTTSRIKILALRADSGTRLFKRCPLGATWGRTRQVLCERPE